LAAGAVGAGSGIVDPAMAFGFLEKGSLRPLDVASRGDVATSDGSFN
jgi:hypothetical protein